MMFALIKAFARAASAAHLTRMSCLSTYPVHRTLLLLIEGTDLGWGAGVQGPRCTLWNIIFLLMLTPKPGEAYVQSRNVSRVGKSYSECYYNCKQSHMC